MKTCHLLVCVTHLGLWDLTHMRRKCQNGLVLIAPKVSHFGNYIQNKSCVCLQDIVPLQMIYIQLRMKRRAIIRQRLIASLKEKHITIVL
jgi:hypothetical protein